MSDQSTTHRDPERFLQLFLRHERRIYAFIVSVSPTLVDAEDLLQETCLVLWQKFDQFKPGTDFVAWACRIAQLRVLKFSQKRRRSRLTFSPEVLQAVCDETIEMGSVLDIRKRALMDCLAALPVRDRDLLQRRYSANASPKEIAGQVNRSVDAVYKALSRIHQSLLSCVQRKLNRELNH